MCELLVAVMPNLRWIQALFIWTGARSGTMLPVEV